MSDGLKQPDLVSRLLAYSAVLANEEEDLVNEAAKRIIELEAQLAESNAANQRCICVYCGKVQQLTSPDEIRSVMAAHIADCANHPFNRIVRLMTAIEALVERTAECLHCCDLGDALDRAVSALGERNAK